MFLLKFIFKKLCYLITFVEKHHNLDRFEKKKLQYRFKMNVETREIIGL